MFLFITLGLAALYRWGASRRVAQWRWITPGALLATIVTMAASGLFSWYVASFGSYNATYGSLGAIFGFMTWLWITSAVVLVGAELNAETEHQTRQDTTVGHPRPLGERGAVMADTVGQAYGASSSSTSCEPHQKVHASEPVSFGRLALLGILWWLQRQKSRQSSG
jgi:membrane protein